MVTKRLRGIQSPFRPPGESQTIAKRCELCGKGPVVGRNVSHAHNVTRRRFQANVQSVRAVVDGRVKRVRVCTRCIRSNRITKAA